MAQAPLRTAGRWVARCALAGLPLLLAAALLAAPALAPGPDSAAADAAPGTAPRAPVRYGRDVRPILSDRCFSCHGTDERTREAGLRLDAPEHAFADRDGVRAIVPGDPAASALWQRITSTDPDEVMPPPHAKRRPLSDAERQVLRAWIEQGAPYEPHWAFVPPAPGAPPPVRDAAWPRDDLDRFVLANLEARGVAPSPEADRATLLRRVHLDLTGLPPTLDELDSFLTDPAPDAYERRVDALFSEEPYRSRLAERLTAPWLDAARYADTCGIHTDNGRQVWLWRDWVLGAFRDNMPYDRFLTEQLAGDLLPDATAAQRIATGFNRNHVTTDEGGAIAEEYLVEYAVDRATTTSEVFLALTMSCARCHDHKYDPITQTDFYSLLAFFNSIDEPGLYSQTADANRAYEPFLEVPTAEQSAALDAALARITEISARLEQPFPGEDEKRAAFLADIATGARWTTLTPVAAASTDPGIRLVIQDDASVQATGPVPDHEDYTIVLRAPVRGQRLLLLEALATPGAGPGAGRTGHGNAVLTGVIVEQRPAGADAPATPVALRWAWADYAQQDRDYEPVQVIAADDDMGWAFDGNEAANNRLLVLLADAPFGAGADGNPAELRITLRFRSPYTQHSLGRVRFRAAAVDEALLARLPLALGRWYAAGPFRARTTSAAYDEAFGPESVAALDVARRFGDGAQPWVFDRALTDGRVVPLGDAVGARYLARTIHAPVARTVTLSLGSDDGFRLFVNGEPVHERRIDRGAAPDQDRVDVPLRAGPNLLVLKVVNTGGPSEYYARAIEPAGTLEGALVSGALPADALAPHQQQAFAVAWRRAFAEGYRAAQDELAAVTRERDATLARVPRTMVMKELPEPRRTFVLSRGQYDRPDPARPVTRAVPAFLGALPDGAPADRRGLAAWMTSPQNPLVARVAVNRLWELVFGAGLVRTSEDFGFQGEWPSHPELLDTLALQFRESGWDVHAMLRRMVLSSTYRQASRVRTDLAEADPENRWLGAYPRRRLSAEQVRDLALFASGLLVEELGGPSVKPYQPDGLWQEVAMPASNTREFVRGSGDDLHRRSLYTYWKRAVPPPALQVFDAPTRESCVVRRLATNTPLQALALWNDTQFVEAARALAQRTLADASAAEDRARLAVLFRRCTARAPDADDLDDLASALAGTRARFAADPAGARALLAVGAAPVPAAIPADELAAWTLVAGGVLSLHETITQD